MNPIDGRKYFKNKKKRTSDLNYFSELEGSDIMITENIDEFRIGEIVRNYKEVKNGLLINEVFVKNTSFKRLDEKLSKEDEKEVKEIIKKQLKYILWQLYTKHSIFIGNI